MISGAHAPAGTDKQNTMKNLIKALAVMACILSSCGTRHTTKSTTSLNVATKDTASVVADATAAGYAGSHEEATREATNTYSTGSGTLTPVNPDKPMLITGPDGKTATVQNASFSWNTTQGTQHSTETGKKSDTLARIAATHTAGTTGRQLAVKQVTAVKATDRKGAASSIQFWVGLAIGACILIWFLWFIIFRKQRNENT